MAKTYISIVSETYRPEINGVANTLGYWVDGLIERGCRVQIVRPRQNSNDRGSESAHESQVTTFGLPIPKYPELKFGLPSSGLFMKLWSKDRPESVYIATEGPLGWSAARVARKLGIPVISGFHTNFQSYSAFYGFGWLERLIMRYLRGFHNQTAKTLVPTQTQKQYLESNGFNNVEVLSRGVDCSLFSPSKRSSELRNTWGADENETVCIYVGRLANEKNVSLIAKAFERLKAKSITNKLVFVGDGPARPELEQRCPDAIFAGMRRGEDLASHYASADLFLFPSKTDTFGNVVTEAMASGLGVVAFDDAAPKEHLQHTTSGYLADLNDDESFITSLERALTAPDELTEIRKNSLATAQSISWDSIVDQFLSTLLSHANEPVGGKDYGCSEKLNSC